jgi:hypothetical protein
MQLFCTSDLPFDKSAKASGICLAGFDCIAWKSVLKNINGNELHKLD